MQNLKAKKDSNTSKEATKQKVYTFGLRNEIPLTEEQKKQALSYAINNCGMPEENIVFNDDMNTYYSSLFGEDRLSIGTDVLPVVTGSYANSRISMYGAIAHELIGHRRAALFGKTQTNPLLEEVQASIRAARFAPKLTNVERVTLRRDALERLHKINFRVKEVKTQLWINEP